MKNVIYTCIILVLAGLGPTAALSQINDPVKLKSGLVSGISGTDTSVRAYFGVPFAAPPVGDLRWHEPMPVETWGGVRAADAMPAACIQNVAGVRLPWTEEFMHQGEISEDCLYLNVWTAAASVDEKRPVMVYIYGGGFSEGSNAVAVYHGEELAKKGVVVVGVNYRVGALGLLAHEELTAESKHHTSGNYGLLDQVAALRWVQDNIAAFGGDPGRVTIFGQSAGAMSVALLLQSPLTKGLIHGAVIQSGPGLFSPDVLGSNQSLAEAEKAGASAAEALNVSSLAELRALSPETFLQQGIGRFRPITDGYFIPEDNQYMSDVPVMNGFTADESSLFGGFGAPRDQSLGYFQATAKERFGGKADQFMELYPAKSDAEAAKHHKEGGRDRGRVSVNKWAAQKKKMGGAVYTYFFNRALPWPEHPEFGAFHTSEVPYVFNNLEFVDRPLEPVDFKVADQVSSYWVNFAKTGNPNGAGLAYWPEFSEGPDQIMALGADMGPIPLASPGKMAFWKSVMQSPKAGEYGVVIEGYDWGPAVSKVILAFEEPVTSVNWSDYQVMVHRSSECSRIPAGQVVGSRSVIGGYVSDAEGARLNEGNYITLVMAVAPNLPIGSPIQYSRGEGCSGNNWINYDMTITDETKGLIWNKEVNRMMPIIDRFDLSGKFSDGNGITMSYASYSPSDVDEAPLIIWLHGGGEGGVDPSIPLIANRAANYASDEIQAIFGGAHVLVPQSPTRWMDSGQGTTRGEVDDIYFEAVKALIEDYISTHPDVDRDRIYVGGCSNGAYLTFKLLIEYPDFFAAAFPSALAYRATNFTEKQADRIKDIPIWFIQSKDDSTTVSDNTVIPVYNTLKKAGAANVHLTLYDHVVDITGFFGGEGYHYPGHWSWIYSHANVARRDYNGSPVKVDGRPVSIMEWMAAQSR